MASPTGTGGGVMDILWNAIRSRVSADKNRYNQGNWNLDLTYITDRIIGMRFFVERKTTFMMKARSWTIIRSFFHPLFSLFSCLAMSFPAEGMESTYRNRIDGKNCLNKSERMNSTSHIDTLTWRAGFIIRFRFELKTLKSTKKTRCCRNVDSKAWFWFHDLQSEWTPLQLPKVQQPSKRLVWLSRPSRPALRAAICCTYASPFFIQSSH